MNHDTHSHPTAQSLSQTSAVAEAAQPGEWLGLCIESWILIVFCVADALSTLILVQTGAATEYNPVMAWFLERGGTHFLVAKLFSFVPFVVACERYRRDEPVRGRMLTRWAAGIYVGLYIVMFTLVNTGLV